LDKNIQGKVSLFSNDVKECEKNVIRFEQVSKTYEDGTKAVEKMDLHIERGEFFVFIGPSGCGKTTTLKLINRLNETTGGDIWIDGKHIREYNIHELRWNIGYVLQQIALFPHMTVEENIAVVPELKGWSKEKKLSRVQELLELVNLPPETFIRKKPSELSGGQQQRIGVARALAADPPVILMDEPFSALDPLSREQLQRDILALKKRINKTIVFVTHDMDEALALGDRICLMREGKIEQIGTPEQFIHEPANDFVRSFIGNRKNPWETKLEYLPVQAIETDAQAFLDKDDTLESAMKLFIQHSVIGIKDGERVVGYLTSQDALRFLYEQDGRGRDACSWQTEVHN
jgi:osmoprotectant transport system ATP-binding protein